MVKRITALMILSVMLIGCVAPAVFAQEEDSAGNVLSEENVISVADEISEKSVEVEETSSGIPSVSSSETSSGIPQVTKTNINEEVKESSFIDTFKLNFEKTFIRDSRWKLFLEGFRNTVFIALCSTVLGVLIGMIIAVVKVLHTQIDRPNFIVSILNFIFNIYTTVIRGTPAVVQLFIAYYIIFKSTDNYIMVSIFAFGINSGAYVSEIVRGGILSIDRGQLEAGRSLGLSYITTMVSVVLPQAIKNILPALGNEFILLLKDTSIAGYIGTLELMKAGNIVRSRTFEPYFSLLSVAAVYLICVIGLEQLIKYFERRMAKSDRH